MSSVEAATKLRQKKAARRTRCLRLCRNSTVRKCTTCWTRFRCPTNQWPCRTWARSARVHLEVIRRLQEGLSILVVPTNLWAIRKARQSWATSWEASKAKRACQSPTVMLTTLSRAGILKMGWVSTIWILSMQYRAQKSQEQAKPAIIKRRIGMSSPVTLLGWTAPLMMRRPTERSAEASTRETSRGPINRSWTIRSLASRRSIKIRDLASVFRKDSRSSMISMLEMAKSQELPARRGHKKMMAWTSQTWALILKRDNSSNTSSEKTLDRLNSVAWSRRSTNVAETAPTLHATEIFLRLRTMMSNSLRAATRSQTSKWWWISATLLSDQQLNEPQVSWAVSQIEHLQILCCLVWLERRERRRWLEARRFRTKHALARQKISSVLVDQSSKRTIF